MSDELKIIQLSTEQLSRLRSIVWSHIIDLNNKDENIRYTRELMKMYFAIGGKNN